MILPLLEVMRWGWIPVDYYPFVSCMYEEGIAALTVKSSHIQLSNTYHEKVAAYRVPPVHPPGGLGFLKLESATCFQDVASHADLLTVLE